MPSSAVLYTGRESGGKYELVVRVEDVDGLGSRSINFAQTEAVEDAGPLPANSGTINLIIEVGNCGLSLLAKLIKKHNFYCMLFPCT